MRESRLFDKVYGAVLGAAIGDAFGIRVEMMHYKDIEAQYGIVDHFGPLPRRQPSQQAPMELWYPFGAQPQNEGGYHPLGRWSREVGAYTDDMRYRLLALHTMLTAGGPIDGQRFAEGWLNYRLAAEGAEAEPTLRWEGPERAYARIVASLGRLTQMAANPRPCLSGWDGPVGLLHPGDPEAAAREGYPMAVAVATALLPGATMGDVIEAVMRYSDSLGAHASEFRGRMDRLMHIVAQCESVLDLREPFYHELLIRFPPWDAVWSLEMVPCALAVCALGKTPREAIVGGAMMGRDADTIVSMVGELMGALYGASAFPQDWASQVVRLNPTPDMASMAEELCKLLVSRAQAQEARAHAVIDMAGVG